MQKGSYANMINMAVGKYLGYIQIHQDGYWDNKSINKLMDLSPEVIKQVKSQKNTIFTVPRFESFALMASDSLTKGAQLIGIVPDVENRMGQLADRLVEGSYLEADTKGVMIAEGLAKYLKICLNDTIVMLGQGYHGANAVGKFPITGVVKFAIPAQNNGTIYMPLELAQEFFSAKGKVTSLALVVKDFTQINAQQAELKELLSEELEIMRWQELQPELVQSIESDNAGGVIMVGILYMVVGFGIFGTIMMMTMERRKEFGVLIAVGMQKWRLGTLLFLETIMLSILGILAGSIFASPILYFLYKNPLQLQGEQAEMMLEMGYEPIIPFSIAPELFWTQGISVLLMTLACFLYPLLTINKLTVIQALKK